MDRMGLVLVVEDLEAYLAAVKAVKEANDQVEDSTKKVEKTSKKTKQGMLAMAASFATGMLAVTGLSKVLELAKNILGALVVQTTKATAQFKVMDAALDASAETAGYTKEQIDELQMAIHKKGVTYAAATDLVLSLLDAEADLGKALELVTTAQNAASRAGGSTSANIQRMLYAMQTANPILLRSMYLTVDFARGEEKLAKSLNKTREQLSESEKMTARMNAIIEAGAPLLGAYDAAMGQAAKVSGSMRDRLKDINVVLGEITYPAYNRIVQEAYRITKEFLAYIEEHKDELVELGEAVADLVDEILELDIQSLTDDFGELVTTLTTLVRILELGTKKLKEFNEAAKGSKEFEEAMRGQESMFQKLIRSLNKTRKEYDARVEAEEKEKRILDELAGRTDDLDKEMRSLKETNRALARAEREVLEIEVELDEERKKGIEALVQLRLDLQRELADRLIDQERDLLRREIDLAREREDEAKETAKAIAEAYADAEEERADLAAEVAEERVEFEREAAEEWLDLERNAARDRERLDRGYADRRVDIETDTRRRLQEIQRQFEQSVQDAARTRDAFALVQAQRRAATERADALRNREEQLADAKTAYERQIRDYQATLEQQREDLKRSLEEQKADLEASLIEKQQDIERQLQEELAAIEEANRQQEEERAIQMQREREDAALQAQWEQEDRDRRLERQLEDMEVQYGKLAGVTAEGLQQQTQEWADAYGPEGAASYIVSNFADLVEDEMDRVRQAMADMLNSWQDAMRALRQVGFGVELPTEFQFQSPKLGLQVGLERLEDYLKRQPIPSFLAGGLPAPATSISRSETYSRSEAQHDVNIRAPSNMDLVVQRQMVGTLQQVLS